MLCTPVLLAVAVFVSTVPPGHCRATRSWQVTDDARTTDGAFAPQDGSIAYVRYGEKHFTPNDRFAFDVVVGVRREGRSRDLIQIAPRRTNGTLRTEDIQVRWLPSGRYMLLHFHPDMARGGWLLASDGSVRTKVTAHDGWFVTNDEVSLSGRDKRALNGLMHTDSLDRRFHPRWLWDGIGALPWRTDWSWRNYQPLESAWRRPSGGIGDVLRLASMSSRQAWPATAAPTGSVWPLDWPLHRSAGSYAPKLSFVNHDVAAHRASPDGKHVIYAGRPDGRPAPYTGGPRDLWVMSSDGGSRRRLVEKVGWHRNWLDNQWVAYGVTESPNPYAERQIGIVNIHSLRGQLLTKGPFHHTLCDFRGGRFLVAELPAQPPDSHRRTYISRLYVIEPLRVRM